MLHFGYNKITGGYDMKEPKEASAKSFTTQMQGTWVMVTAVAEAAAAYVLYFSSTNVAFKVLAGVLLLEAAVKFTKAFVFNR